ncbi:MAG: sorbosone dehydrogenase family protein [Candidatus Eisenbacteria bacterium]
MPHRTAPPTRRILGSAPLVTVSIAVLISACASDDVAATGDLDSIRLPEGFSIEVFADDVPNARSLVRSPNGTIYVGTRSNGRVYALPDADGDLEPDAVHVIAEGLNMPNGVAFRDGSLYVAEVNRILRYDDIESHLATPPAPVIVRDDLPTETHHGWKFIAFGPDGKLYVPIGAPCNICEQEDERFATICRMNADGSDFEVFAHGIRNTVGFTWHPTTQDLWFTDNGRDWLGDDLPPDELNRADEAGLHFGFPYCHAGMILDPDFGQGRSCDDFTPPARALGPHVASLGLRFYTGSSFPAEYHGQIFLAEHGSWNRSTKIGYQVSLVRLEGSEVVSYEPFATGWLRGNEVTGRPVDLLVLPDGSLLVSDDHAGAIYRIRYTG